MATTRALGAVVVLALPALGCRAPVAAPARGAVGEDVAVALESGTAAFNHGDWAKLLASAVRDGRVDYRYVKRQRSELDAYLDRVARVDLSRLAPAELKALLANVYNALVIKSIIDHPTVASIRDIDGVWDRERHRVGGHDLTLDQIEHNLLRPFFRDPRIHFAINCASTSCAPLPPWALEGGRIDAQLDELTTAFLRDPRQVRIEGGTLRLSRYFQWFADDFTAADASPRGETPAAFVARYSSSEVARFIEAAGGRPPVRFLDYDWSLNATVPHEP